MMTVEEVAALFPNAERKYEWGSDFEHPSYMEVISKLGTPKLVVEDKDYQGDTRVLYEEADGRIGFLVFGWGSCSGCDALQGADSYGELTELINDLQRSTKWFASKAEALAWFRSHDWKGDFSWYHREMTDFLKQAFVYLGGSEEEVPERGEDD